MSAAVSSSGVLGADIWFSMDCRAKISSSRPAVSADLSREPYKVEVEAKMWLKFDYKNCGVEKIVAMEISESGYAWKTRNLYQ